MKYSNTSGTVRWSEGIIVLRNGQSIDDDHPLLTERPDLFDAELPGAEIKQRGGNRTHVETTSTRGATGTRVESPVTARPAPRGSAK